MLGTFIAAIVLLAAMLYLIVRPFVWAPKTTSADVAHEAIPAPVYADVAATTVAAAPPVSAEPSLTAGDSTEAAEAPAEVPAPAPEATQEAGTSPANADDVRLRVEALIAARKVEMSAPKCPTCQTAIATSDAFCRSCGTKLN